MSRSRLLRLPSTLPEVLRCAAAPAFSAPGCACDCDSGAWKLGVAMGMDGVGTMPAVAKVVLVPPDPLKKLPTDCRCGRR
jgi:hypothetical protein